MNMQQMLMQAQKMQRELNKALSDLESKEFTIAKGGAITITMLGSHEIKAVDIKPDFLDAENKDMIEDLIVIAHKELLEIIENERGDINEKITGRRTGMGIQMGKLKALDRLEDSLSKLPSVGKKSAERMAYAMLDMDEDDLTEFSDAIKDLKASIHICPICGNLTESSLCDICSDSSRDQSLLMVVSYPKDLIAFEKAGSFHGLYHILGGTISVSKGKNIDDLSIPQLINRLKEDKINEVIIATNPTVDGETTAL